jgi:TolB-like protein/DNA-binding winged helix-turn-helix (wHTH) protein/Tfp pilus assembly protein PilF
LEHVLPPIVRFEDYQADLQTGELRKNGTKIRLSGQPFQILALLLEKPGELITREELRNRLWPDEVFVDFDHSLNAAVNKLREALCDSTNDVRFIETLPKRGYRFIGPIEVREGPAARQDAAISPEPAVPPGADAIASDDRVAQKDFLGSKRGVLSLAVFGILALLALAAALVGMNVAGWRDEIFARRPKLNIQALAVLPLANLSGDTEQEFFADGMTEALITELGKISGPRVISRQSVMEYKGSKKSLAEIARELNVDAVLEGAVARSGDRVKVTVHLAQASPERQLWAHEYDRSSRDVLSLQDEIAGTVADEIQVKLTSQERAQLSRSRSVNPEAYADYLRGRSVLAGGLAHLSKVAGKSQYTEQDIQTAIAYFKSAIDKDPAYAQANAGLADAYIHLGNPGWGGHSPKETLSDAKEAATTALKLDSSLPEAHFSLAQTLQYDWNWPEAEKEYKLALKLNPYYVNAHLEYGRFVQALGRNDEALVHMHYADELDPFNIAVKEAEGWVTYASRQYDVALKQFESLGDEGGLIHVYREKGMYPEAIASGKRWTVTHPSQSRDPYPLAVMASIYGLQGRNDEAEALIKELRETARHRYVSGFFFAEAYVGLGQNDQAITWLDHAYEEHDQWMVFANSYPGLDRLHSEPRFQALMRRMNFPQ